MPWKYTKGHFPEAKGFIFLGHEKKGACTITLVPAASMSQAELDQHGEAICRAMNARKKKNKSYSPFEDTPEYHEKFA
jgi:hypothetical protein